MSTPIGIPGISPATLIAHKAELEGRTWVDIDELVSLTENIDDLLGLLSYCAVADESSSKNHVCEIRSRIRKVTSELSQFYSDSLGVDDV